MDTSLEPPSELEKLTLALLHSRGEVERLREREAIYSSLLGSVNAALWAFDWDEQRVIYVSPAYERIFGRSAALLLADYGEWRNSIYPDDVEYAAESLAKVLETGAVEFREYRIIRADGEAWLHIAAHPDDDLYANRLHEVSVPTLVLHGEDDPRTEPGELDRIRRDVPHAEIHMLAGAGHSPHSERGSAATCTTIVARWLAVLGMA